MNVKHYLSVSAALVCMVFSCAIDAHSSIEHQQHNPTLLAETQRALIKMMGISPLMVQSPRDAVSLPIFANSALIVNKTLGFDFDDGRRSLHFATFVTDSHYDDVVSFYKQSLPSYAELHKNGDTLFVKVALDGGTYPDDYYHIPNIDIFPTTLVDGSDGTMFVVMYHMKNNARKDQSSKE
ncbi:hypothetical protein [Vibrio nitrifigilis]|uniref:Uncharacterized protein n=1 Tax=Vibrio nitrifigilis TaxID=2789781 RepID=A0ABS0GI58_9VIBR|nr:hypothetical protein [Vibrio nitrifigilis]MBF9002115.1 hypothetical protein [Vibrio nitrifigilis]